MKFLITGGAGFIGSHIALQLHEKGHEITIIDDFSTGNNFGLDNYEIINCNIIDYKTLVNKFNNRKFDFLIHLASKSIVEDSFLFETKYMQTNVLGTSNIIKLCRKLDIKKLIFSSTAAVYGNQNSNKMIDEKNQTIPINPYGISKLQAEYLLKEASTTYKIDMICFRFFNACGGDKLIRIGEYHNPETHLIPKLIQINLKSNPEEFNIYGNTFNTPDGYAYRDYLNVLDICRAIELGVFWLNKNRGFKTINLGSGEPKSVMDIIKLTEKYLNKKINFKISKKRKGEPAFLLSNISKANEILNWRPQNSSLKQIIDTSIKWQSKMLNF